MKTFKLHLIRHGLTQGNLDGLYVGSGTDLPLCDTGRTQLLDLTQRFTYPTPEVVFSSPLKRAVETSNTQRTPQVQRGFPARGRFWQI